MTDEDDDDDEDDDNGEGDGAAGGAVQSGFSPAATLWLPGGLATKF